MIVLSLFDGYSGGQKALSNLGIKVDDYYASEVDKYAIGVTNYNFPKTIQIGDVRNITYIDGYLCTEKGNFYVPVIDAIIGGSPCTDFSFAGKGAGMSTVDKINVTTLDHYLELKSKGYQFQGQSYLFWEYVRLMKEINPDFFFLENVMMVKKWKDLISFTLGVDPIFLDSNLVSAQNRKRLYWTNIKGYVEPKDRGILLKDIVHESESEYVFVDKSKSYCITGSIERTTHREYFKKNQGQIVYEGLAKYIVPFDETLQILDKEVQKGKIGYFRKDSQANRVYYIHGKSITLTGESGGGAAKMGQYLFECITPVMVEKSKNSQRFNECNKFYTLTNQGNHGILIEGYIRKLTPIECERLQTLPDNYTKYGIINNKVVEISNSKRYKMVGNGWTIEAIEQFFINLSEEVF